MKKIMLSLVFALSILTNVYAEGDAELGKTKAATCNACHGANGISNSELFPNLAGQHADYIIKQLKAFQSGNRVNALMSPMTMNLNQQDMEDIAAYFSSLAYSKNTQEDTSSSTVSDVVINPTPIKPMPIAKTFNGDIEAGKLKAITCSACHGVDGNAVINIYPKLAGQHEKYITKQLNDFKKALATNGKEGRVSTIMSGMAAGLSSEDIKNLAAFYASQTLSPSNAVPNEIGKKLYMSGDAKRNIAACSGCHSVDGNGMGQAGFPVIQAQNVDYLKEQLTHFKEGIRANDHNNMMQDIASKLSHEEIQALTEYISSLK